MSFPIKAKIFIYVYIYMNRNFNSGHLFINPPGKRSVDSQPVKMKPKTRAMQGIWSWLGNRTSLKGKLCIETNGIADPCLFVCLFVWWFRIFSLSSNSKPIPPRIIDFHPQIFTRYMTFEVDQPDLLEQNHHFTRTPFLWEVFWNP